MMVILPINVFQNQLMVLVLSWLSMVSMVIAVDVTRDFLNDKLTCPYTVDCTLFGAVSDPNDPNSCVCEAGTLYFKNDRFKCIAGESGQNEGCGFYFEFYDKQLQAMSLDLKGEFLYDVTTGGSCVMEIIAVETYGTDLKWTKVQTDFYMAGDYIRIIKDRSLLPEIYSGQLLKFNIKCTSGSTSRTNCLIAKITGQKTWSSDNIGFDICNPQKTELLTTTPLLPVVVTKSSTIRSSTIATGSSKSKGGTNIGLIAGIIVGLLLILLAIILIIFCLRRRKRSSNKEGSRKSDTITPLQDPYNKVPSSDTTQIQNIAYQTSLNLETKPSSKHQIYGNDPIYSNPDQNYEGVDDAVYTSPYEEPPQESEYNQLVNNNPSKTSEIPQQYSILKKKEMTLDEKEDTAYMTLEEDDENYEPLHLKVKPNSPKYQRLSQYEEMQGQISPGPEYMESNVPEIV